MRAAGRQGKRHELYSNLPWTLLDRRFIVKLAYGNALGSQS
jgi:hypothetical protein